MAQPARIAIRAPPHLPYIQGYTGIPASPYTDRPRATVSGTVELRLGSTPIKAKWLRVEIRQHEGIPPGYPYPGEREGWKWIDGTDPFQTPLWKPPVGQEFGQIEQKDYAFTIPLPEDMPPSVDLGKGSGVKYELLACLCYKQRGGVFKKDSLGYVKTSETLQIVKHEMHSAWTIFNVPDSKTIMGPANSGVQMTVQRPNSAFGPGDRLLLTATMHSSRPKQFKLKGFEAHLYEIITVIPPTDGKKDKRKSTLPTSKKRAIAMARFPVDEKVQPGGEKSARLDMTPPPGTLLASVRGARTVKLEYELEIKSVCESSIPEMKVGLAYTVGSMGRRQAEQLVREIGWVEALCPGVPPPSVMHRPGPHNPSIPSFPPTNGAHQSPSPGSPDPSVRPYSYFPPQASQAPQAPQQAQRDSATLPRSHSTSVPHHTRSASQPYPNTTSGAPGFLVSENRRKSSTSTITASTDFSRSPSQRNSSVMPRNTLAFPSPNPAGSGQGARGLARANTAWTYVTTDSSATTTPGPEDADRYNQSDSGHGHVPPAQARSPTTPTGQNVNRFSTSTFGRVDLAMSPSAAAGVSKPSPPRTKSSPGNHSGRPVVSTLPPAGSGVPGQGSDPARRVLQSVTPLSPQTPSSGSTPTAPAMPSGSGGSAPSRGTQQWPSAEQEKLRLYATARAKAAATQAGAGHELGRIGMEDASPPPPDYDYAPPSSAKAGSAASASGPSGPSGSGGVRTVSQPAVTAATGSGLAAAAGAMAGAAAEKEAQRRRYEDSQRRVASGPPAGTAAVASPASASASTYTQGVVREQAPATYAANGANGPRVARDAGVVLMNGDAPIPYDQIFPSGPSTAASSPVLSGPRLPVAAGGSPIVPAASTASPSRTNAVSGPGAAAQVTQATAAPGQGQGQGAGGEKDQVRRYYEAQDRVARAAGGAGGSSSAATAVSNGTAAAGPSAPGAGMSQNNGSPSAGGSALGEKEQMKRYYEAQDRVAKAAGGGAGAGGGSSSGPAILTGQAGPSPSSARSAVANGATSSSAPITSFAAATTPNVSSPNTSGSAMGEKEQMRRYYEAQDRVARAGASGQASSSAPGLGSSAIGQAPPPAFDGATTAAASSSRPVHVNGSSNGSAYPSAEQEKDAMRRRYEAATASVHSRSQAPGAPAVPSKDAAPTSNGIGIASPIPVLPTTSGLAGTPVGAMLNGGSGPPLPSRPPQDYVRLLTPGPEEQARRAQQQQQQ